MMKNGLNFKYRRDNKPMIDKLIKFFKNIKQRIEYSNCYDYQEDKGLAIFEMCNHCNDKKCPYYVEIGE